MRVNSETAVEGVGEDTGGEGKAQVDEDEHRRYDYKDPVIPSFKGAAPRGGASRNYSEWRFDTKELFRVTVKS